MKHKSEDHMRVLTELTNAIGEVAYQKADELVEKGHEISVMDMASCFLFCVYRTIDRYPETDRIKAYVEAISYHCMIAENETKEEVFKFVLDILRGYSAADPRLTKDEVLHRLFPPNGKSES